MNGGREEELAERRCRITDEQRDIPRCDDALGVTKGPKRQLVVLASGFEVL